MENIARVVKKFQPYSSNGFQGHPLFSHRFLITIIVVVLLVGVLPTLWTYRVLQSKFEKQDAFKQSNQIIQGIRKKLFSTLKLNIPTPTPTPLPASNWGTYVLDTIKIEFQLPPKLNEIGELKEELIPTGKGTKLCTTFAKQSSETLKQSTKVLGSSCKINIFAVSTTSKGYEPQGTFEFLDLQGFSSSQGKYYVIIPPDKTVGLAPHLLREVRNPHKVVLLKVTGENDIGNAVVSGTPGAGWIGAIINLPNETYPALIIQMELTKNLTEEDFDQLLATIKFTEQ